MHDQEVIVINRPAAAEPRWNLVAQQIGGEIAMRATQEVPGEFKSRPPDIRRQDAVLIALSSGMGHPDRVAQFIRAKYGIAMRPEEVGTVVNATKTRYKARTTGQALAVAISNGSVPIAERSWREEHTQTKKALFNLASGVEPHAAMADAIGQKGASKKRIDEEWQRLYGRFDVYDRYALLTAGFERGIIPRAPFMFPYVSIDKRLVLPYTAPAQILFSLPPSKTVSPSDAEREAGRWRTSGLSNNDTARMLGIANGTVKTQIRALFRLLEAEDASEMGVKMRVLGLAGGERHAIAMTPKGNITSRELSTLVSCAQGMPYAAIGKALKISEDAVKERMKRVMLKLGVCSQLGAVACMFETGVFKVAQ
ncbi:MAG TPA: LuxR C-terminal-related transcriptional regulator [Candidatus Saccharimonadales bacterium]|nr:LuxR C-terminal-related transcriptional regulator [Candidatus Saccharimonadales bacterium]